MRIRFIFQMPFEFIKQKIPEVFLIVPKVFPDARGKYLETYKRSSFKENGIFKEFLQDNQSISKKRSFTRTTFSKRTLFPRKVG